MVSGLSFFDGPMRCASRSTWVSTMMPDGML
jgi:hypothetical protein